MNLRDCCCFVLIVLDIEDVVEWVCVVGDVLKGGDVVIVIVFGYGCFDDEFQCYVEVFVLVIQVVGVVVFIVNDSCVVGCVKVDGMYIDVLFVEFVDVVEKFCLKFIVGVGCVSDCYQVLEVGEFDLDYVFFGKIGGDIKLELYFKNFVFGEWWVFMVFIFCIIMGGIDLVFVFVIVEMGVEFVVFLVVVFVEFGCVVIVVVEVNVFFDEKVLRFE